MDKAKLYNANDPDDRCRCPQYKPKHTYNTSKTKIGNIMIIDLPRGHCKFLFVAVVVRESCIGGVVVMMICFVVDSFYCGRQNKFSD